MLFGDTAQETSERSRAACAQGFHAVKFCWGPFGRGSVDTDADQLQVAREGAWFRRIGVRRCRTDMGRRCGSRSHPHSCAESNPPSLAGRTVPDWRSGVLRSTIRRAVLKLDSPEGKVHTTSYVAPSDRLWKGRIHSGQLRSHRWHRSGKGE